MDTVLAIHREQPEGDVLAFLTGQVMEGRKLYVNVVSTQEEVERAVSLLREHAERTTKGLQLLPLPLYGGLPYSEQVWKTSLSRLY